MIFIFFFNRLAHNLDFVGEPSLTLPPSSSLELFKQNGSKNRHPICSRPTVNIVEPEAARGLPFSLIKQDVSSSMEAVWSLQQ